MRLVFDIETDGLLHELTQVWVICTYDLDSKVYKDFVVCEGDTGWRDYLYSADVLIGHNIINFDLNALRKTHGWVPNPKTKIIDTLLFSQVLKFRRFGFRGHGLAVWGEALGFPKVEHEDWTQYSPEMLNRCQVDTRLNVRVYNSLAKEYKQALDKEPLIKQSMQNEHAAAQFMAKSELNGWAFNKEEAQWVYLQLREAVDSAKATIEPMMGLKTVIKDKENGEAIAKLPKWTMKGFYHASTAKWFGVDPESGLWDNCIVEGPYCRVEFKPRSLSSDIDAKDWLFKIGWEPDDWNFKRDPETRRSVATSPKISSSSLELLGDLGKMYDEYLTNDSRANILKGWIASCDEVGRVHGGAMCFGTPTGRMTHKIIANVPSVGNPWGREIRSLFIADPGTAIVGCDSAGNQARGLCHYLNNEAFTDLLINGDIHQDNANKLTVIARSIGELGANATVARKTAKPFFYALLFGAGGPKLALTVFGKRSEKGNQLKEEFMKAIPGFSELNKKLENVFGSTKRDTGFGYIYGLDGSKVYSDSFHKVLNYLLQRFESVTVKSAVAYMMRRFSEIELWWQPLIINHDEVQFLVKDNPDDIETAKAVAKEAFSKAAEEFGVFITDGEAKHGYNWADTH